MFEDEQIFCLAFQIGWLEGERHIATKSYRLYYCSSTALK
jgi:hypothetical protein